MPLNSGQQKVFDSIIHNPTGVHLIASFAGTGKTYLAAELARYFIQQKKNVAITATTNKAVKVLKEKMGVNFGAQFMTIHSLLGFRVLEHESGDTWLSHAGNSKLNGYSIILVDEISMLETKVYLKLTELRNKQLIISLGDIFQLSPIADNKPSKAFYDVNHRHSLITIVRQEKNNPIIQLSKLIRDNIRSNKITTLEELNGLRRSTYYIVNSAVKIRNSGIDVRILAYTNKKVLNYNKFIHEELFGKTEFPYSIGERILIREGSIDYDLNVGDEYDIFDIKSTMHYGYEAMNIEISDSEEVKTILVCTEFDRLQKDIAEAFALWRESKKENLYQEARYASDKGWALKKAFATIRHVYAQTVHSAQGSTMDAVLVDYKDISKKHGNERNRLLYVAISRSKKNMRVIG